MKKPLPDIHTHNQNAPGAAVINLPMSVLESPDTFSPKADKMYSAGIFPLYGGDWEMAWQNLKALAAHPQIKAVGECGLDKRSTIPLEKQKRYLEMQMQLADSLQKPLIIHCVRCWNDLLEIHRRNSTAQKRIIHGFRGKPQLAAQLLGNGLCLSFGILFNKESLALCPPHLRYCETDDHPGLSVEEVYRQQEARISENP